MVCKLYLHDVVFLKQKMKKREARMVSSLHSVPGQARQKTDSEAEIRGQRPHTWESKERVLTQQSKELSSKTVVTKPSPTTQGSLSLWESPLQPRVTRQSLAICRSECDLRHGGQGSPAENKFWRGTHLRAISRPDFPRHWGRESFSSERTG